MKKIDNGCQDKLDWFDGKHINEILFCQEFLKTHPMRCIGGTLFTVDGPVESEELVKRQIIDMVQSCVTTNLSKRASSLLESLKIQAYSEPLPVELDRIHCANGIYFLDGHFEPKKVFCNNRLSVSYNPAAPKPLRWLQFLSELLEEDDILTLQEYLGYCLIPSTKGQKMLMLIGRGGEGKSRIGLILNAMFHSAMNVGNIQKVETNRFARADLEHRLLMVDDDMDMNALPKTNYIKSIVTAEAKMDLERKGIQSYQGQLYVRFLCFGNGSLTSLYDHSDGFYRRQLILTTKERPAGRKDDPFLVEKMLDELEGIFLWCLEGDYPSISIFSPDFSSTVKWSSQTMISSSQRFTSASSKVSRCAGCCLIKSCSSLMRAICASLAAVSTVHFSRCSQSLKISSATSS